MSLTPPNETARRKSREGILRIRSFADLLLSYLEKVRNPFQIRKKMYLAAFCIYGPTSKAAIDPYGNKTGASIHFAWLRREKQLNHSINEVQFTSPLAGERRTDKTS